MSNDNAAINNYIRQGRGRVLSANPAAPLGAPQVEPAPAPETPKPPPGNAGSGTGAPPLVAEPPGVGINAAIRAVGRFASLRIHEFPLPMEWR